VDGVVWEWEWGRERGRGRGEQRRVGGKEGGTEEEKRRRDCGRTGEGRGRTEERAQSDQARQDAPRLEQGVEQGVEAKQGVALFNVAL
jgi:hypothetical protein